MPLELKLQPLLRLVPLYGDLLRCASPVCPSFEIFDFPVESLSLSTDIFKRIIPCGRLSSHCLFLF